MRSTIERLARAACLVRNIDPDAMVPEQDRAAFSPAVKAWRKYEDAAITHYAMSEALKKANEE